MKFTLSKNLLLISLIVFAAISRIAIPTIIGHPVNFSPIDGIALFTGAFCTRISFAMLATFLSVWIGDLLLNQALMGHWIWFYEGCYWQYGSYFLMVLLGTQLAHKITVLRLMATAVGAAILFYSISNFGVWFTSQMYPPTWEGLLTCYVAALPFLKNTLLSDLFYSFILFGSFIWLKSLDSHKRIFKNPWNPDTVIPVAETLF